MPVAKLSSQAIAGYEQIAAFHKANLDAFIATNTLFLGGFQSLSNEILAEFKEGFETSASKAKLALEAPSVKDALELTMTNALAGYQKLASTSAKLTQAGFKIAQDALAPVASRVTEVVGKPPFALG